MKGVTREPLSVGLAIVGSVLLLLGVVLFYARAEILAPEQFADKAEQALADDEVKVVVSREIVVNLVETGSPDLVAGRPVLESVVGTVIDTTAFRKLFRRAALEANRVFFDRNGDNLVFDIADASKIVRFGLQQTSPELAKEVPKDLDVTLADLRERSFAQSTLGAADDIRVLGLVLPLLALLTLAGSVFVAADRRLGTLRVAVGVGAVGVLLAVGLMILREVTVAGTYGSDELTDDEVRGAVGGILNAYFGQLFGWSLLLAFVGIVVAGAAAALDQKDLENPTRRLRERLTRAPATTAGRAGRAVAAVLAGFLIAAQPEVALRVIALLVGAYLVFWGASELLLMLEGPAAGKRGAAARRQRTLRVAGATAAAVVAAIAIGLVLILDSAEDPETSALGREGCNGSERLCDLPLDRVMFAGTHNSFSAADSPGWLIANHRRDIPRQLRDGVRLFLIDTHWGVEDAQGRVKTDFEAEQRDRNKVVSTLPPEVLAAATRLTGRIGLRAGEGGEREAFLCHTTCELGATRLSVALDDYRTFLDRNPGEVVILFVEPYVEPEQFQKAIEEAGLDRYVKTLELGEPMPTLGELVEEDRRLVVFAEEDGGDPPWYLEGFAFVQDTPLGATKTSQASCALERGNANSPFLMINHWADTFPPQRKANVPFQTEEFLLKRIRRCERERGLPVSLIATDHYDQGDFLEVVDRINAQRAAEAPGN